MTAISAPRRSFTSTAVAVLAVLMTLATAVGISAVALESTTADAQSAVPGVGNGRINWRGWNLGYDNDAAAADIQYDGLAISQVSYNGTTILGRASLPVMNVYYDTVAGQTCGPFADRLGGFNQQPPTWREFVRDGVTWLQIGVQAQIGNYGIYQAFFFGDNGQMDAHIFSRGLECSIYHEHIPFFRFDFDISGTTANDQILRQTTNGLAVEAIEFDHSASAAVGHNWMVRDTVTGDSVTINFNTGQTQLSGGVIPETNYVRNQVYGRSYSPNEINWDAIREPLTTLPWNEGQSINGADSVLWYTGFLPHSPAEGQDLWHSTGVRLTVQGSGVAPTPAPTAAPRPTAIPTAIPTSAPRPTVAVPTPIQLPTPAPRPTAAPRPTISLPTAVPRPTGTCGGRAVTVDLALGQVPTERNDVILGTPNHDYIAALGGSDLICGGGGNDTIYGGDGNDSIWGEAGNDKLRGGNDQDSLYGGDGLDDLNGGRGNDEVYGEAGDDLFVRGGTGDDYVNGGPGNDAIVAGNGGADVVDGGDGNDKVTGGPRPDTVHGGSGNDEVKGGTGADQLFGQAGSDQLFGGKQIDALDGGSDLDSCNGGTTGPGIAEADTMTSCESHVFIP